MPDSVFLPVELECPSYGSGVLKKVSENKDSVGKSYINQITYSDWTPAKVELLERKRPDGVLNTNLREDLSYLPKWFWLGGAPDSAEWEKLLSEININSLIAIADVTLAFDQVCNGDEGFKARYHEFLRRNRADLDAAPGTPLYNEPDPTLEPLE